MNIQITAKKIEIPAEIRDQAKEKISKLEKFNHKVHDVEVVIKAEERRIICETIVRVDNRAPIIIEVEADTIQGAIDLAMEKCERQLRKDKERESVRRRTGPAAKNDPML